jgi:hypothetical protein
LAGNYALKIPMFLTEGGAHFTVVLTLDPES